MNETLSIWPVAEECAARAPGELARLAARYLSLPGCQTPVLLVSRDELRTRLRQWQLRMPVVTPFFAVKANNDPLVLRELFGRGANADVASAHELRLCQSLGLTGGRIIVSNPRKDRETLEAMRHARVFATAVDSHHEVDRLAASGLATGCEGTVVFVRVKVPTAGVLEDLSTKFGVRVVQGDCNPLERSTPTVDASSVVSILRHCWSMGFRRLGLSFHVGTQCSEPRVYASALRICGRLIEECRRAGLEIWWLDLGGGYADDEHLQRQGISPTELFSRIHSACDEILPPGLQVIAEPGRCLVADAGTHVSQVIFAQDPVEDERHVQIDDGVYRSLSGRLHDHKSYRFSVFRHGGSPLGAKLSNTLVWGISCDSVDWVARDLPLPADLRVNDYLLLRGAGAYTNSFGSNTNGFQPAAPVLYWWQRNELCLEHSPLARQNDLLISQVNHWHNPAEGCGLCTAVNREVDGVGDPPR